MKKSFRILGISVAGLFLIYITLCIIGPAELQVTRTVRIQKPLGSVMNQVTDFSQWRHWSAWAERDTNMSSVYTVAPHTIGHHWEWKSESEGDGSQEIVGLSSDSVRMELRFAGFDKPNYSNWKFTPQGDGTTVSWTMDGGKISFPFRGMVFLFIGNLETDFEEGLANLKKHAESAPANQ